jgi:hypothetical protein
MLQPISQHKRQVNSWKAGDSIGGVRIMLNILEKLEDFRSLKNKNEHLDYLDNLINIIKIINILNIFEKTHTPFTMLPKRKD